MRYQPLVNIAVQAARSAGNIIMRALDRLETVQVTEKKPNDYVTEVDRKVEEEIIAIIHKAHPEHGILGEESGKTAGKNEDTVWIIDPIDGTRNFIHGFPQFCVSIAVSYKNKIEHGVIYDPVKQELFTASKRKGATLNDRRIRVSNKKSLGECLLGTGFAHRHSESEKIAYLNVLSEIIPLAGDPRRAGAAALDLAYVACGRLDGFWEMGLKIWDIAAGVLLIKEAGGMVTDLSGGESYLENGNLVTANPKILKLLLPLIKPHMG